MNNYDELIIPVSRGTIIINEDGKVLREELKNNQYHRDSIKKLSYYFNKSISSRTSYEGGINASINGLVVLQIDGGGVILYLPEYISDMQYNSLINEMNERYKYSYHIVDNCNRIDTFSIDDAISYINNKVRGISK